MPNQKNLIPIKPGEKLALKKEARRPKDRAHPDTSDKGSQN